MIVWQAHKVRVRHMAFSPDGAELATAAGSSKFVWTWRAATGEPTGRLVGNRVQVRALAYSPDGRFVAAPDSTLGTVWDRASRAIAATLATKGYGVEDVAFSPDSAIVGAATTGGIVEWRAHDFEGAGPGVDMSARFGPLALRVLFSPCGRYLVAVSRRGAEVYTAEAHKLVRTLTDPLGVADAARIAFSPDGDTLAVVFGLRVHLFALPDGKEIAVFRGHPNYIHALGFMPDGRAVISAGADGIVRVWDPLTGAEKRSFDWGIGKVCAAAVSPNGMLCAAGGDNGQVVVWDVDV